MVNWERIDIESVESSAKCGEDDAVAGGRRIIGIFFSSP
jgi:hypothetical protein